MLKAERTAWPWAALPFAAVLAVDPWGLAPFGPVKWALVTTLVLAGFAGRAARGRAPLETARSAFAWHAWALPAFVAWAAITALFGLDRVYAWTGTPERHFGVITWVLVLLCWSGGRALDAAKQRLVLASVALTVAVLGAWAGAEALGWTPLRLVGTGDRPIGPLGSSAFLGAAAALLTPVAFGWVAAETQHARRVAACVAATGGLVALAVSGARAALFGAAVIAVVTLVVRRQRAIGVAIAGAVVVVIAVVFAAGAASRVSSVASDRNGGAHGRLDEWRIALRVVGAHPVLGTGPEGYRLAFGTEVDDRYERAHGRNPLPDRAHSALLDVAATTGLVGLALYALAVGAAAWAALRALRHGPPLLAGAAVGVLAYFVQSLFLFPIAELEPIAWLLAGMCVSARPPAAESPSPLRVRRGVAAVAGALAVVALAAGVLDVIADQRAKRTLATVANDRPAHASVARLRPDQVRYRLIDAQAHAANGSSHGLAAAIADVDHALRVSPRDPVARREKGRLLLAVARLHPERAAPANAARAYLERLVADDPRDAEVLLRLGVARDLAGDQPGAIAAWRRAEYLAPRSAAASSNLAVAYARAGRDGAARAAAERALRRDPSNGPARAVLDDLEANNGT